MGRKKKVDIMKEKARIYVGRYFEFTNLDLIDGKFVEVKTIRKAAYLDGASIVFPSTSEPSAKFIGVETFECYLERKVIVEVANNG